MKRLMFFLLMLSVLVLGGCARINTKRVAVMDFDNLTGADNYQFLKGAMGEYLTSYLTNSGIIMLRERQDIGVCLAEIDGSTWDKERYDRLRTLGKKLKVQYIVLGSVSRLEGNFVVSARLFSVKTGEVIPGTSVTQSCRQEYELYDRAQLLGGYLFQQLKSRGAIEMPGASTAGKTGAEESSDAIQPIASSAPETPAAGAADAKVPSLPTPPEAEKPATPEKPEKDTPATPEKETPASPEKSE
jgi:TolB-like protein